MKPPTEAQLREFLERFPDVRVRPDGMIKIRPSISWVPVVVQVVSLLAVMGYVYGSLGGRLNLIEYRLAQIESKLARVTP